MHQPKASAQAPPKQSEVIALLTSEPSRNARAREVMEYEMSTAQNDYWWWADGLYMAIGE